MASICHPSADAVASSFRRRAQRAAARVSLLALSAGLVVALGPTAGPSLAVGAFDGEPTELHGFGANGAGQRNIPTDLSDHTKVIRDVSAGYDHALAVTTDGQLHAWGNDTSGEGHIPLELQGRPYKAVAAGQNYSLALTTAGTVVAWGSSTFDLTTTPDIPAGRTVTAISAGGSVALALDSAGIVHAWGNNSLGQLDIPQELYSKQVVKIAAGGAFAVAATADHKVFAWGYDLAGQATVPASLQGRAIDELDAGFQHAVALLDDGTLVSWGANSFGQLDAPAGRWDHVSAGGDYTIGRGRTASVLKVWGKDATTTFANPPFLSGAPARITAGGAFAIYGMAVVSAAQTGSIQGTARVGEQLSATLGTFRPLPPTRIWGSWRLAGGETLAEGTTYTPTSDQVGKQLVFDTNGELARYQVTTNNTSIFVLPGRFATQRATITGTPQTGKVLTATASFTPQPDRFQYDWHVDGVFKRATADGRYIVQPDDLGKRITVSVAGFKAGYDDGFSGFSDPTAAVTETPKLTITREVAVPGTVRVGQQLTLTPATTTPTATSVTYQWVRGLVPIAGATDTTYTPTAADRGQLLAVKAQLSRDGHDDATSWSNGVSVTQGVFTTVGVPQITGAAHIGSTLQATVSSTPDADAVRYDWYAGATLRASGPSTYRATAADLGLPLSVRATLTRAEFATVETRSSAPTEGVTEAVTTKPVTPAIKVTGRATVGGKAVAGLVLSATAPITDVSGTVSYQWLRSGRAVTGATNPTFQTGAADVGRPLSVVATVQREGWLPASSTSTATVPVAKATPALRATTRVKSGRLVVKVRASAAGLPALRSTVLLRSGKHVLKRAKLVRGRLVVALPRARAPRTVTLAATSTTKRRTVPIARPRGRVDASTTESMSLLLPSSESWRMGGWPRI